MSAKEMGSCYISMGPFIILLPGLTLSVVRSFMSYTMIKNKNVFTNILISFMRSWSHTPCSAMMIKILVKPYFPS